MLDQRQDDERARLKAAGFTDAEIDAELGKAPANAGSLSDKIGNAVRLFAQGRTMGMADEAIGSVKGALGIRPGENQVQAMERRLAEYKKSGTVQPDDRPALQESNTRYEQGKVRDARQQYGATGTAIELLGGLQGGMDTPLQKAGAAWKRIAGASGVGTAAGALTGYASGETPEERLSGAMTGAIGGGIFGGFGAGIGEGLAARAAKVSPKDKGLSIIVKALKADRTTPGEVAAKARATTTAAPVTAADFAGDNMRRLTDAATLVPSESGGALRKALGARGLHAGERFGDLIDASTGTTSTNVNEMQDAIKAFRAQASGPLFEAAATSGPVSDARLIKLAVRSPEAQTAYSKMEMAAKRMDLPVPSLDEFVQGAPLDARAAHWWKLEMDGISSAAKRQATGPSPAGMTTTTARQIGTDAKALRNALADVIPEYGKALQTYERLSKNLRAYRAGATGEKGVAGLNSVRRFTQANKDDVETLVQRLTPEERAFYTKGAAEDLRRTSADMKDGADRVSRFLGDQNEQAKFSALLEDPARLQTLLDGANMEEAMRATERAMQGSPTEPRRLAQKALSGNTVLDDAIDRGSVKDAAMSAALRWYRSKRLGSNAESVAKELSPKSREEFARLMDAYEALMLRQQQRQSAVLGRFAPAGLTGGIAAPLVARDR